MWTPSLFHYKGFIHLTLLTLAMKIIVMYQSSGQFDQNIMSMEETLTGLLRSSPQVYCESIPPNTAVLTTSGIFFLFSMPAWDSFSCFCLYFCDVVLSTCTSCVFNINFMGGTLLLPFLAMNFKLFPNWVIRHRL